MPFLHDPGAYRARSVARPRDEASKSVAAFWEGVIKLANEHKVADVMLCARMPIIDGPNDLLEGDAVETVATTCGHIGDPLQGVEMAAYASGHLRAEFEARLGAARAAGERHGRGK